MLSDDSISSATKKTKKRRTLSVNSISRIEEIDSEFEDKDFEKEDYCHMGVLWKTIMILTQHY
ncbi:ATV_HP_G0013780.mRNA.1.CDS.1 [Saccharomyces cerevisiae]|nr:ATV_HP_G0013780.mRNA.1.CDS.1 [Saccharomyces cerevisiae]CAI6948661.1 ATV_HP_G0013780.mRNA.1.CDS.1 [Saccharomyces cerevisiae]